MHFFYRYVYYEALFQRRFAGGLSIKLPYFQCVPLAIAQVRLNVWEKIL